MITIDLQSMQLRITRHAYKRHRQRVGRLPPHLIQQRCQTALSLGHYRHGEGLIRLCGIWWGCVVQDDAVVLITCYGRQRYDMIEERRHHACQA